MAAQKNILFISYDGMTDPLGQSQVIPYLEGLSKYGYRVILLSCEKKGAYQANRALVSKILKDSNITWIPLSYTKKPPVLSTLIDIVKLKRAAKKIHWQNRIDMVHTRPGIPALIGLWMKKKFGIKFLNDIREFYADSRVEGGMWNTKSYIYKKVYHFFREKEIEQVALSDGIVCLTYAAEKVIRQWPAYNKKIPLAVIPCSVDLDLFSTGGVDKEQVMQYRTAFNIQEDDLVISYLGSIGGWYLTAEMMQFCKMIFERAPGVKFLFISPHRHRQIVDMAAAYDLPPEKIVTVQAKRRDVPALLSLSNYSLFFIKPCYSKISSSPTKHGEIMAMGIPVITNGGVGDVQDIVEKYQAGFIVDDFSDKAYGETIGRILSKPAFNRDTIRSGASDFYALKKAIELYRGIYEAVLNPVP